MAADNRQANRIHYLDNLRALAMLLGVYLHSALAYAEPSRAIWLATDRVGSRVLDMSIWWIHLFRMSLFFLLSGYFAKLLVSRRGLWEFVRNRGIRIALPFVLFYPVLFVALSVVIVFAVSYVQEPQGLLGLIVEAGRNPDTKASGAAWSTMHLWFLYYLLMFSLIAAMASRCSWPKFRWPVWLSGQRWLLVFVPLVLVPGVLGGGVPVAAPESFEPAWWPFLFYGLFYWAGWLWYGREETLERWQPWCWWLVGLSCVLFVPYYSMLPVLDIGMIEQGQYPLTGRVYLIECVLTAYLSVLLTISTVLVGQRLLSRSSGWLKFCADSSYWVYLLHLPIVLFLQTLLIPAAISVWLKLFLVTCGTWLFCAATYVVFVRYTPIGWMLHGKRTFP